MRSAFVAAKANAIHTEAVTGVELPQAGSLQADGNLLTASSDASACQLYTTVRTIIIDYRLDINLTPCEISIGRCHPVPYPIP